MNSYEALALELMDSLDKKKKGPPNEEISATMRGEMAVLRLLDHAQQPMAAGEISKTLSMTTSRIAAVLGSLEKKAMILRHTDALDKRRVLVTLTHQGSAFCQARKKEALCHMTALLAHLGEEDAAHFVRIMKRIHEFMPEKPACMHKDHPEKEDTADE